MSNELRKAIETARRVHDRSDGPADGTCVILGALIRAVEILAGDQGSVAGKIETPTSEAGTFSDELVERLAETLWGHRSGRVPGSPRWQELDASVMGHIKPSLRGDVRAILSELAKTPCELPEREQLAREAWYAELPTCAWGSPSPSDRFAFYPQRQARQELLRFVSTTREAIRRSVAPILAAKDAAIEAQAKRIAELETAWDMLKKSLDESDLQRNEARVKVAELEKRLAEAAKVSVVDGKTPGQLAQQTYWARSTGGGMPAWEATANAVLRTFGSGAEALRSVRKAIYDIPLNEESRNRYPIQIVDDAAKIVDAELAKLGKS